MSKIRVNRIENNSTANGGIDIDTSGHVKVDGLQMPTAGPLSSRNFVTNGAMQIAQRSTAAVTNVNFFSANIKYDAIDRWGYWASQASKFTVQQVADAPAGFYNSLKITSLAATTHGAGDAYTISQRIEAQDLYSACLGTANAKNLVVSFWVKSSLTGTFAFYMLSGNLTTSFVQNYTINAADTWEYKTISIPGPTSGTYNVGTNNYGVEFGFSLGSGTSWDTATLGSWENVSYQVNSTTATSVLGTNGATFQITGVQIELGDKATSFEHRSYCDELARCERYFCKSYNVNTNPGTSTSAGIKEMRNYNTTARSDHGLQADFPVRMRATPSVNLYSKSGTIDKITAGNTTYGSYVSEITATAHSNHGESGLGGVSLSTSLAATHFAYYHFVADAEI